MMLRQYIISVICTVFIAGIISFLSSDNSSGKICRIACSLMIISTVFSFSENSVPNIGEYAADASAKVQNEVSVAVERTNNAASQIITSKLEEYAEQQAHNIGLDISVEIIGDGSYRTFETSKAYIKYSSPSDYSGRHKVEEILKNELGIETGKQEHFYE